MKQPATHVEVHLSDSRVRSKVKDMKNAVLVAMLREGVDKATADKVVASLDASIGILFQSVYISCEDE